ncbi:MAG: acetate/propionate family kinase [Mycoplasmataceae bacterium]|jgi:acetate kinase|nr:acetate/propionate family kinase [Mycoplasmataceae bacterium]
MNKKIIVINAGSSSIKFKIFLQENLQVIASGLCERIFVDGHFNMKFNDQQIDLNISMPDHTKAIECVLEQLKINKIITDFNDIVGVGHRVVLAGAEIKTSVKTTPTIKDKIREYIKLAPLHNEPELIVVEIFEKLLPHAISVASFDNTFHLTIPEHNYVYPIDQKLAKQYAIRRYGFHGNSYRYITIQMQKILNKNTVNLIVCHLGNGASISAIKANKSYATSMGLTPLEGLIMGTRCGDIDPSIPIYLFRQGFKNDAIDNILNKQSGVQALCGSSDMRDVQSKYEANNPEAILTITMYANSVAKYIVDYVNQLENKIDALVFTAGIGENSVFVIKQIIDKIKIINLKLNDQTINTKYSDYKLISAEHSVYPIYCVRTDEELMIANDVNEIIQKGEISVKTN